MNKAINTVVRILLLSGVALMAACGGGGGGGSSGGGSSSEDAAVTVMRPVVAGQSLSANLRAGSSQSPGLMFELVDRPKQGIVSLIDPGLGAFVYTANTNALGSDGFGYRVHTATYTSPVQWVYIPVLPWGGQVLAAGQNNGRPIDVSDWRDVVAVAGGFDHTVGLRADGTVVATGWDLYGQLEVGGWRDIVAIAAGDYHTLGVKADGTVVVTNCQGILFDSHQCDVGNWRDIVAVAAGSYHTVGLKADSTVVAAGCTASDFNDHGQCAVGQWRDIIAVAASEYHTVGLRADGRVVAAGCSAPFNYGQCDVSGWRDIVAIAAGEYHTVGLKADGTVVATGCKNHALADIGQCDVSDWRGIVMIAAHSRHTVGVKLDRTVVAAGDDFMGMHDVGHWRDIVAIAAGSRHTVGLVAAGGDGGSGCGAYGWGVLEGQVLDAVTSAPLSGVSITATGGGETHTFTNNASGLYWSVLPAGNTYSVEYRKNGYVTATVPNVSVCSGASTILEGVRLVPQTVTGTGTVTGSVRNAIDGTVIQGAAIHWRAGIDARTGTVVTTSTTGNDGTYTVNLNSGSYTGEVVVNGYTTLFINVTVVANVTFTQHVTLSPTLLPNQLRVVLTWGGTPADLDAHIFATPCTGGAGVEACHVFWGQQGALDRFPYMQLDVDDMDGHGPETITINVNTAETYLYLVHDYTNSDSKTSTALSASGAQVRVYGASGLLRTFNVPAGKQGNIWTVFQVRNGEIIPVNQVSN